MTGQTNLIPGLPSIVELSAESRRFAGKVFLWRLFLLGIAAAIFVLAWAGEGHRGSTLIQVFLLVVVSGILFLHLGIRGPVCIVKFDQVKVEKPLFHGFRTLSFFIVFCFAIAVGGNPVDPPTFGLLISSVIAAVSIVTLAFPAAFRVFSIDQICHIREPGMALCCTGRILAIIKRAVLVLRPPTQQQIRNELLEIMQEFPHDLSAEDAEMIESTVDAGEEGLAFEFLLDYLMDREVSVPASIIDRLVQIANWYPADERVNSCIGCLKTVSSESRS